MPRGNKDKGIRKRKENLDPILSFIHRLCGIQIYLFPFQAFSSFSLTGNLRQVSEGHIDYKVNPGGGSNYQSIS